MVFKIVDNMDSLSISPALSAKFDRFDSIFFLRSTIAQFLASLISVLIHDFF